MKKIKLLKKQTINNLMRKNRGMKNIKIKLNVVQLIQAYIHSPKLFIASRALSSQLKVIDVNHNLELFIVSKTLTT